MLRRFAMPARFHEIPQLGAYARAARLAERTGLGWIAFLDAHEFLLPAGPGEEVAPDIGSASFTWAVCGSPGHLAAGPGPGPCGRPLCEGAEARTGIKLHDTILRPEVFGGSLPTPHHVHLGPGFRHAGADRQPLGPAQEGIGERVFWAPFRINRDTVRSRGESVQTKRKRCLVGIPALTRSIDDACRLDLNGGAGPVPGWMRPRFEAERAALLGRMGSRPRLDRAKREQPEFEPPAVMRPDTAPGPATCRTRSSRARAARGAARPRAAPGAAGAPGRLASRGARALRH